MAGHADAGALPAPATWPDDTLRPARPPRDRARPRGRRVDGRDDRPDHGDHAARSGCSRSARCCPRPATAGSGTPKLRVWSVLMRRAPQDRDAYIELLRERVPDDRLAALSASTRSASASWPPRPTTAATTRAGTARQLAAILASGSRTAALRQLDVPTVVIHGESDPLVPLRAGVATAQRDPRSRADRDPRNGPRPAPRAVADVRGRDREERGPRGEAGRVGVAATAELRALRGPGVRRFCPFARKAPYPGGGLRASPLSYRTRCSRELVRERQRLRVDLGLTSS